MDERNLPTVRIEEVLPERLTTPLPVPDSCGDSDIAFQSRESGVISLFNPEQYSECIVSDTTAEDILDNE
jgi:hypothetical protein